MPLSADEQLTRARREFKYLVPAGGARDLVAHIAAELADHHHAEKGSTALPNARHHTTTVYFDTPSRTLYRAAKAGGAHRKLRAREYYDIHPELVELATDPMDMVRYHPILWLELKLRDGDHSEKTRVGIPKHELHNFFTTGEASAEMLKLQRANASGAVAIEKLRRFATSLDEPLDASCVINYRRRAFQDPEGGLRVTLDYELSAFAPTAELFEAPMVRQRLGRSVHDEPHCIVEVKTHQAMPAWLQAALLQQGAKQAPFSKFIMGSGAVTADNQGSAKE
ncbi:MAG: polyphosphate polymerase domain-containing protein [Myxococcales bacterium]|nr:polyphosphate polymerase domain-containing protein [Myxococcales bacterium]